MAVRPRQPNSKAPAKIATRAKAASEVARPRKVPAAENQARPDAGPADVERIRVLEAERDRLVSELEIAKDRINSLEEAREQVLNRIDWVIDSLHSLQG